MFWLWLSVCYAGIQAAQHVGEITGLQGGERGESDHPPSNTMWPGLHPCCGQLKSEPVMHICALFYCCSILLWYAQRPTNKAQFPPCSHIPDWSLPPPPLTPLCLPLSPLVETHLDTHRHALQRMQRYRSYIEAAFQWSPHGVDDRVLLKRKKACRGDFKSEEDIRKIHWKKSPLAVSFLFFFFFTLRNNFVPFLQREMCVQWRGGRKKGGTLFFLCRVWSAKDVMKTNWQAVTIYLSCCRSALTWRGKTGPLSNPVRPARLFFFPPSCSLPLYISFSRQKAENSSQTELMFSRTTHKRDDNVRSLQRRLHFTYFPPNIKSKTWKKYLIKYIWTRWNLSWTTQTDPLSYGASQLVAEWKRPLDGRRRFSLRGDNTLKRALSHPHCFLIHTAPPKPPSPILAFLQLAGPGNEYEHVCLIACV